MLETANFTASLNNDAYIDIDVLPGLPWRMVVIKELFWNLSEFADGDLGYFHFILCLVVLEKVVLVALVMIEIIIFFSNRIRCLRTEDEVNPLMELSTSIVRL